MVMFDPIANKKADKLEMNKANKQQGEWVEPTLINGVTGTMKYRINEINQLEVVGNIELPSEDFTGEVFKFHDKAWIPSRYSEYVSLREVFEIQENLGYLSRNRKAMISSYTRVFSILTGGGNYLHYDISIITPL